MNALKKYVGWVMILLIVSSCKTEPEPITIHETTPYIIDIPFAFPTKLNIPEDNPMTVEGVELGRLFVL